MACHDMISEDNLHEKVVKIRIGVGPLVSSQERRAAGVLQINRASTNRCVSSSVYTEFRLFVFPKRRLEQFSSISRRSGGQIERCSPGRSDPSPTCPAHLRPASPPCAALLRTARDMYAGFRIERLTSYNFPALYTNKQTFKYNGSKLPHNMHSTLLEMI